MVSFDVDFALNVFHVAKPVFSFSLFPGEDQLWWTFNFSASGCLVKRWRVMLRDGMRH